MKPPDDYCPRKGDAVLIMCTVRFDKYREEDDTVYLTTESGRHCSVQLGHIRKVVGRHWEPGTKVRSHHNDEGEVIAISDNLAWVKLACGVHATFDSMDLEEVVEPVPGSGVGALIDAEPYVAMAPSNYAALLKVKPETPPPPAPDGLDLRNHEQSK